MTRCPKPKGGWALRGHAARCSPVRCVQSRYAPLAAGKFVDQRKRPFFPPSLGDLGGVPQVNPTTCSTTRNHENHPPVHLSAGDQPNPLHDPWPRRSSSNQQHIGRRLVTLNRGTVLPNTEPEAGRPGSFATLVLARPTIHPLCKALQRCPSHACSHLPGTVLVLRP